MQHEQSSTRQKLHTRGTELIRLMLDVSEAERKAPLDPGEQEPTARHKTLSALAVAARENIRAFLTVYEHMK